MNKMAIKCVRRWTFLPREMVLHTIIYPFQSTLFVLFICIIVKASKWMGWLDQIFVHIYDIVSTLYYRTKAKLTYNSRDITPL